MTTTTNHEPGCYISSHVGHYMSAETILLAESFGYDNADDIDYANRYMQDPTDPREFEFIHEAADTAIDWLNDNASAPDHSWSYNDGELYYLPDTVWDDMDY